MVEETISPSMVMTPDQAEHTVSKAMEHTGISEGFVYIAVARAIAENGMKWEAKIIHQVMEKYPQKHRSYVQHAAQKVRSWLGMQVVLLHRRPKPEGGADCVVPKLPGIDKHDIKALAQMNQAVQGLHQINCQLKGQLDGAIRANEALREEVEVLRAEVGSYRSALGGGVDDSLRRAIAAGLKAYNAAT